MKTTRNILMTLYWIILALAGIIYICGELLDIDMALLSHCRQTSGVIVQMIMILFTLAVVPLALRLFKFKRVNDSIKKHPTKALLQWGVVRLCLIGIPLVVNTILYYVYGYEPAFGYLAVMVLLTMPFVLPTMDRCKSETEP